MKWVFLICLILIISSNFVLSQSNRAQNILNECTIKANSNTDSIQVTLRTTQSKDVFIYLYDENVIPEIGALQILSKTKTQENNIYTFKENKEKQFMHDDSEFKGVD